MTDQRPYAALLAKGEDRRERILAVAQRLLARNGWRNTSLAQIAREAGVTPAGLLHHFESKEQLLHAVLEVRDTYDDVNTDLESDDLATQIAKVAQRFERAPELMGTTIFLMVENLDPGAPLHDRLLGRYRQSLDHVAEVISRGQREGRYRTDLDAPRKAVEIIAFINGMELSWLLDPSIPLAEVFKEYAAALARELERPPEAP
jgi:AcrR family transcriptional regulator